MRKNSKKTVIKKLLLLLALALIFFVTACNSEAKTDVSKSTSDEDFELNGATLTIWKPLLWPGALSSAEDNLVWKTIQERLGVDLVFIQPVVSQVREQFSLMIAGDSLPDIISTDWAGDDLYTGGLDKYVSDGVLLPVNDLAEKYAPDYLKMIREKVPEDEQMEFYTDSGNLVQFYAISPYEEYAYSGILYRQDWMDELGLSNPKTLGEVEATLQAFKDVKGAESPLILAVNGVDELGGAIVSAFDIGPKFYQKDGVVSYGPVQPEFKSYLTLMSDWYAKGLIDQDFVARDDDSWKRMMTTGVSGSLIHSPDTIGTWMDGITSLMGGYNPVIKEGDTIKYRLKTFRARPPYAMAITTECETPEIALQFLNYGYTEEGWMLFNYGLEGETYNLVDGKAVYTDQMMNNSKYPNINDCILMYKVHIGPFLRFEHEGNPAMNETNAATRKFWTESSGTEYVMPMIALTSNEGAEFARIMNQVDTYRNTAVVEFIIGSRSLDEFDEYVDTIKKLGIDEVTQIQQDSYDRYISR